MKCFYYLVILFSVVSCGSQNTEGMVEELIFQSEEDGELIRIHENSPVQYNEVINFSDSNNVEEWTLGTSPDRNIFGNFGIGTMDKNSDGDMDQFYLLMNTAVRDDYIITLLFIDKDFDKFPDIEIHGSYKPNHGGRKKVDLNIDGQFDIEIIYGDFPDKMLAFIHNEWKTVTKINDFLKEENAVVTLKDTGEEYKFHKGKWLKTQK